MKTEKYTCDINNCDNDVRNPNRTLQIIFTTEQTEGRRLDKNQICQQGLDVCDECFDKILRGNAIFAHGAMGHNTYHF